jgi:hypothetical protein
VVIKELLCFSRHSQPAANTLSKHTPKWQICTQFCSHTFKAANVQDSLISSRSRDGKSIINRSDTLSPWSVFFWLGPEPPNPNHYHRSNLSFTVPTSSINRPGFSTQPSLFFFLSGSFSHCRPHSSLHQALLSWGVDALDDALCLKPTTDLLGKLEHDLDASLPLPFALSLFPFPFSLFL